MKKKLSILFLICLNSICAQVPTYVPTNGLVAYYPFNGNANDLSGNGNNGTNNGASLTTDRFGNVNSSYNFQNSSNTISIPHNSLFGFQATSSFTISIWCNISNLSNVIHIIGKRADFSPTFNWQIAYGGGYGPNFGSGTGPGVYNGAFSSETLLVNTWYHLVGKFDNGIWSIYINGVLKATNNNALANPDTNTPITIGNSGNWQQSFYGKLDDIGIWNRALTQQEITNLYIADTSCQSLVINTGLLSFNPPTYTNTVTIYPNPANDHITIDCGTLSNVSGWNIKITNALGQEVFNQPMNTQQYVVPLNTWTGHGVYFVKIYNDQGNLVNTKKIILQ